jgi:hypothetical protein
MQVFKWSMFILVMTIGISVTSHAYEIGEVDVHGFVSQGYVKTTQNKYLANSQKGSSEYHETAVNFSSNLDEKLRVGLQLLARDLGTLGNNEVKLDWGIADYHFKDWLGFRFGKVKVPRGLYNESADVDMLRTFVLLPQSNYYERIRLFTNALEGAAAYGNIPLGPVGSLDYHSVYGTFNIEANRLGDLAKLAALIPGADASKFDIQSDTCNFQQATWNTPLQGLRLVFSRGRASGSLYTGSKFVPYIFIRPVVTSGSMEFIRNDLALSAEYEEFTHNPLSMTMGTSQGYYGRVSYRLFDWLEAGTYYGVYYADKDDKDGKAIQKYKLPDFAAYQKDWTSTLRFDITPNWLIKLEAHHLKGTAQVKGYDKPSELEKHWNLYTVKTTISF